MHYVVGTDGFCSQVTTNYLLYLSCKLNASMKCNILQTLCWLQSSAKKPYQYRMKGIYMIHVLLSLPHNIETVKHPFEVKRISSKLFILFN